MSKPKSVIVDGRKAFRCSFSDDDKLYYYDDGDFNGRQFSYLAALADSPVTPDWLVEALDMGQAGFWEGEVFHEYKNDNHHNRRFVLDCLILQHNKKATQAFTEEDFSI